MATYKVIQDIEAEDTLLGPLTLKQFVFAAVAAAMLFAGWFIGSKTTYGILFAMLIPAAPFIFLAAPLHRDQPNDVWLAARLRYFFKPRVRKWDQTGQQHLVTITAPKNNDHIYTDGLSGDEVRSRLKTLAATIDSRGWAVKNVGLDTNIQSSTSDQRLLNHKDMPIEVPDLDIRPDDDMLDAANNAVSQHLEELMNRSTENYKQAAINRMQQAAQAPPAVTQNTNFSGTSVVGVVHPHDQGPVVSDGSGPNKVDPSNPSSFFNPTAAHNNIGGNTPFIGPGAPTASNQPLNSEEQDFLNKLHQKQALLGISKRPDHEKVITPISQQTPIIKNKPRKKKQTTQAKSANEPQIAVVDLDKQSETEPAVQESNLSRAPEPQIAVADFDEPDFTQYEDKRIDDAIIKRLAEADELKVSTIASMAQHAADDDLLTDNTVIELQH